MKIILIGASGTIGKHIYAELKSRHEVIAANRKGADVQVDITDRSSIQRMFDQVKSFDSLVCAAGEAHFGPFNKMNEEDFYVGIRNKMMGQINLVMVGKNYINDEGSFTLTSGILYEDPIPQGVGLSVVNGAINSFVLAAAIELKRNIRINAVCAGMVEDSAAELQPYFPGHLAVSMKRIVAGYSKSAEGKITGQIIKIY